MRTRNCALSSMAVVIVVLLTTAVVSGSSVNDCQGVRNVYRDRGWDPQEVPRQPRQGSNLEICPRGLTCCTAEMERKLRSSAKDAYQEAMQHQAKEVQRLFNSKAIKFDEFFTDLLATSKLKFHKLFQKTYGIIYERNSDVFIDFFRDLEEYYDSGKIDLEDALRRFFTQLYQRMFTVFNAQQTFDYAYLSCVSQTMKKLQPFGDVPKTLSDQLRRSFVATRTFAQALLEGKQAINKILKIEPRSECVEALTRMSSCSACQGIPYAKPCPNYCINVMKGCLAYHAELGQSWDDFVDHLQILSDRLVGPFDIEAVVDPIGVKISDAIMNFQNSGFEVTSKVFEDCGRPRIEKRQATQYGYAYGRPLDRHYSSASRYGYQHSGYMHTSDEVEDTKLKKLIKEIRESVGESRGFWTKLPYDMCKADSIDASVNRRENGGIYQRRQTSNNAYSQMNSCWNGRNDNGRYDIAVVSDGLPSQALNPEVRVDISKPDVNINEQILALKLITTKLESASNGNAVDWPSPTKFYTPDPEPGSGCDPYSDDEDCYDDYDYDSFYYSGSGDGEETQSKYDANDDTEEETLNWPPWVTSKPDDEKVPKNLDDDINVVDTRTDTQDGSSSSSSTTTTKTSNPSSKASVLPHSAFMAFSISLVSTLLFNLY